MILVHREKKEAEEAVKKAEEAVKRVLAREKELGKAVREARERLDGLPEPVQAAAIYTKKEKIPPGG